MPINRYLCSSCGLSFRKRSSLESMVCDCGEKAYSEKRGLSVGFSAEVSGHFQTQSTGMESLDLDFDRVIGEDARQKWDAIYQRRKDKWDLLSEHRGATGYDLLRDDEGGYLLNQEAGEVLKDYRDGAMEIIRTKPTEAKEN